jgi:hypothetical protein
MDRRHRSLLYSQGFYDKEVLQLVNQQKPESLPYAAGKFKYVFRRSICARCIRS